MWKTIITIEAVVLLAAGAVLAYRLASSGGPQGPPVPAPPAEPSIQPADTARPAEVDPAEAPLPALSNPWVLVDKSDRVLTVYDGDRPVKRYRVDVGRDLRDKQREGDMRTPEGEFYICMHKPDSSYTRALGLSYPNAEDARRGLRDGLISRSQYDTILRRLKKRGIPPWKTTLGGEIFIHGNSRNQPGKTWTAGCVGLVEDRLIHELYERLPNGTKVIIRP